MKQYHKNPRQIKKKEYSQLEEWLRELGDLSGIVHDLNSDEIIGGNQRSRVFNIDKCQIEITQKLEKPDDQGTVALGFVVWEGKRYAYRQVRWNEKQCEKANIVANKAGGSWDFDILANEFELDELLEWGFSEKELGMSPEKEEKEQAEEEPDAEIDMPPLADYLFETDNDYGIPVLDLKLQPVAIEAPVARWGQKSRHEAQNQNGTLHFYTEDYKFSAVWKNPMPKIVTGASCLIEPNYSTNAIMPIAVGLYGIFKKRWLSRFWQSCGKRIVVDLNVDPKFEQYNLVGVPKGWSAYATRFYADLGVLEIERQYSVAEAHAGRRPLFVVVGGGKIAADACNQNGWVHIPQENHIVEGRYG